MRRGLPLQILLRDALFRALTRALTYTSLPWVDSKRRILIPCPWRIASVQLDFLTLGGIASISILIRCAMVDSARSSIKYIVMLLLFCSFVLVEQSLTSSQDL